MIAKHPHTPGPWKVMPCPQHHGKHPFHDSRWIATDDATPQYGYDPRSWMLESGHLICEMRDGDITANARLIAAAPDLLAALERAAETIKTLDEDYDLRPSYIAARAAIAKVEGNA